MQPEDTPPASTLVATAEAYMQVFTTLDPETISEILSQDYKHDLAPSSTNFPAPFDREGFMAHIKNLSTLLRSFPVRSKQTWPNPSLRQVLIWADSETIFHDHLRDSDGEEWTSRGEYMWLLTMDKTGHKVEQVLEFLDSKSVDEIRGPMTRALARKKSLDES
ncbi:hypothetical protein FALBO_1045 [Fusarium albosuccineum]|uniref:SnoaL-like domain-containing protein n=1 Tax=Fusarium albosuccineum TaxID=1237068 RepID=A0A8H4PDX6_9HYPO|nr:hypothetical protein FALBO_1045 [Fusarium albosuccineum]